MSTCPTPPNNLLYALGQSGAKVLVLAPGVSGDEFIATMRQICSEVDAPAPLAYLPLPELKQVVVIAREAPTAALTWSWLRDMSQAAPPTDNCPLTSASLTPFP